MKKILFLSLTVVAGAGLLVLLIAAINKKNHKTCTGVDISLNGKAEELFLTRQDVMNIIVPDKNNPPRGKPLASFNLKQLESALEQNVWVKEGQLFFDNNGVLRVSVAERSPVARIFTANGNSFYIDSSGRQLPLNNKITVKLPVYSNFPAEKERLNGADSLLIQQVKQMSAFMLANPFWLAQIAQVDITPNRTFEMIPVVGKHVIVFGDGTDYVQKFHRLFLFYKQVSAEWGMDKYSVINVSYSDQVVATKKGTTGKIDSIQAIKNIQKLIAAAQPLPYDTVSTTVDNNIGINAAAASTLTILKDNKRNGPVKDSFTIKSSFTHPLPSKNPARQPSKKIKPTVRSDRRPKAVMRRISN